MKHIKSCSFHNNLHVVHFTITLSHLIKSEFFITAVGEICVFPAYSPTISSPRQKGYTMIGGNVVYGDI